VSHPPPGRQRVSEPDAVDVLLVELGSTTGLQRADDALAHSLRRAGASVAVARAPRPGEVPTMMLTDLRWARAARRAAARELARLSPPAARAVIYSSTTAALLWPRPGAIRFDAPAAANRPGRHGLWQRPLERRRLRQTPLLLPWSDGALAEARVAVPDCVERSLVIPAPIDLTPASVDLPGESSNGGTGGDQGVRGNREAHSDRGAAGRDIAAITYAANPRKKGFDRVLEAWRRVRRPSERLVVAGVRRDVLREAGLEPPDEDVEVTGPLPPDRYQALLRRARVFVCAPRREDYGLAQLEALAAGCRLVTAPAPGPYVALPIARRLDPRLVSDDLGSALRAALDEPPGDYAERAARLVEPFGATAIDRLVANELLPRLLG
jgi:glycosyltransferase involved in cell wall biosynthesis